ncbi:hypothetical protein D3C71_1876330 [compost metagenome]
MRAEERAPARIAPQVCNRHGEQDYDHHLVQEVAGGRQAALAIRMGKWREADPEIAKEQKQDHGASAPCRAAGIHGRQRSPL